VGLAEANQPGLLLASAPLARSRDQVCAPGGMERPNRVTFAGIGLFMAGTLRAEVNLAAANGLYLVFLLLGGMIVPITKLPSGVASVAKLLPPEALSAGLHASLGAGSAVPPLSWAVLAVWAVAAPLAAALTFRWE